MKVRKKLVVMFVLVFTLWGVTWDDVMSGQDRGYLDQYMFAVAAGKAASAVVRLAPRAACVALRCRDLQLKVA